MFADNVDLFEGLRVFPRDPAQLRHHLSHVNHTLQTRYCVVPDVAEFALQPERTDEFYQYYQNEVQRIIAHLNKTTRGNLKVRADPRRMAKGMELRRSNRSSVVTASQSAPSAAAEDPAWVAMMSETGKKLAEQHAIDQHRQAVAATVQSTPVSHQGRSKHTQEDELHSTGGGVVDSDRRPLKESCLFSTPPEFNGFTGPMETPSDSDGRSPTVF